MNRLAAILLALSMLPCVAWADAAADAASYLLRIEELDDAGPELNAVIVANPDAPALAEMAESAGLPLAGRTVLVKDNIETREWPTTAGSLALIGNDTGRDAPLIARLRDAGGVVLGKTNLSEWSNLRSPNSTSGWSAVGGLTRNPHAIDRNTCGSSSGSAAAVAASLSWAAIGTETSGSIVCPAAMNGIVGLKPTVGLVSRTGVIPVSDSLDTAGPMARSVRDAAMLLNAISGSDPADPATADADRHKVDFTEGLDEASLDGVRIGVLRRRQGRDPRLIALFEQALSDLESAGASLVELDWTMPGSINVRILPVLLFEMREGLDAYLSTSPADIPVGSLADVIAYNRSNADDEMRWFGQEYFETAVETRDRDSYEAAHAELMSLARDTLDRLLKEHDVRFLIAPITGPAWSSDLVLGDRFDDSIGAVALPAVAGYPHLTVPMGAVEGLPVGLGIFGAKWDDHRVLKAGAAYESARTVGLPEPSFVRWQPPD